MNRASFALRARRGADWAAAQGTVARMAAAIAQEGTRYADLSPIARGPAEVSHALLRLIENREYLRIIGRERASLPALRRLLGGFVGDALALHAADRGVRNPVAADVGPLIGQLELWAALLAGGRIDRRQVRTRLQVAVSEVMALPCERPTPVRAVGRLAEVGR